jgi:hypothetical protein
MPIRRKQMARLINTASGDPGVISTLEVYTLDEAKRRLRWTDSAVRSAKRRGLRLIKCGKRKYVSGQELLRFLESISPENN